MDEGDTVRGVCHGMSPTLAIIPLSRGFEGTPRSYTPAFNSTSPLCDVYLDSHPLINGWPYRVWVCSTAFDHPLLLSIPPTAPNSRYSPPRPSNNPAFPNFQPPSLLTSIQLNAFNHGWICILSWQGCALRRCIYIPKIRLADEFAFIPAPK